MFSRNEKPSAKKACVNPCKAAKESDDTLSTTAQERIQSFTGKPEPANGLLPSDDSPSLMSADSSACKKRALSLGPTLRRFNRYREAMPYARAANDMNKLGDKAGGKQTKDCLTRLPDSGEDLCKELGLPPGTITDQDLRDDSTGFRAEMYRDEASGKLILVARDTQPKSLVDWQTNTRNGEGKDTDQYAAMRDLSGDLADNGVAFDVAGYSKGGGLAQEAALVNPSARAYVFNSAGLHENSLVRTGAQDFQSLESRTRAFSADNDFLTYMNETRDPQQQIDNARFLRRELEGENRSMPDPMKIDHRNPELSDSDDDPKFEQDRAAYFKEIDGMIVRMEQDQAAGRVVRAFPPVRAGQKETIPGSDSWLGNRFGANDPGPNLGKLVQHQMGNVLGPMEKNLTDDRKALQEFLKKCP
ncbi:MAG: hypothetical protein Q8M09_04355 [Pseudomonadota bacterium]|nr:hypothetical protein [Pseudomonadota bacterium]MDP1903469.1 hypothetical protein [Pseudomonadota bacterium]MDP2351574.1 hypothetical protein [Pseudomonadota bacterium]